LTPAVVPALTVHIERIRNKLESCSANNEDDRERLTDELNLATEAMMSPTKPIISNFIE